MHQDIKKICDSLDQLADAVVTTFTQGTDQLFSEIWGWPAPMMNRNDLSWIVRSIAEDLRRADPEEYAEFQKPWIISLPARIALLQSQVLPTLYGGNTQAFTPFLETLKHIRDRLLPAVGWVQLPANASLPANLTRRVTAANRQIERLESSIPNLGDKVIAINLAHQVAENLDVDLESLADAREAVTTTAAEAVQNTEKTRILAGQSAAALEEAQLRAATIWGDAERKASAAIDEMQKKAETAEKLIAQCEAAYHITTTKGLAGAFDQRAKSLSWSMWVWVLGLASSLGAGSYIGSTRLSLLTVELAKTTQNWPTITTQIVLAVLGVGAPLWFSWLATKQIGQRFRLAEDYAYKASVAKAYEGYRKEAAILDPEFQSTLFKSALTRLDEAPLRLVSDTEHSSPWQEMLQSPAVQNAIKLAPDLPSKFMNMVNETVQQAKSVTAEATRVVAAAKGSAIQEDASKPE